jgi:hypothetical protein
MPGHPHVEAFLTSKGKPFTSGAGITTLTAGQANFDQKEIAELERACHASGQEVVFTAGAMKIRPKDSNL